MNDLAQILLQDGKGTNKMSLKGVFYRQFLPSSNVCLFLTKITLVLQKFLDFV